MFVALLDLLIARRRHLAALNKECVTPHFIVVVVTAAIKMAYFISLTAANDQRRIFPKNIAELISNSEL